VTDETYPTKSGDSAMRCISFIGVLFVCHQSVVRSIAFTPDGRSAVLGPGFGAVWDLKTGDLTRISGLGRILPFTAGVLRKMRRCGTVPHLLSRISGRKSPRFVFRIFIFLWFYVENVVFSIKLLRSTATPVDPPFLASGFVTA
jgi:WD40 repeat protein